MESIITSISVHIVTVIPNSKLFTTTPKAYKTPIFNAVCINPNVIQLNGIVSIFNKRLNTSYKNQNIHQIRRKNGVLRKLFAGSKVIA
jgi:hypothetical protein